MPIHSGRRAWLGGVLLLAGCAGEAPPDSSEVRFRWHRQGTGVDFVTRHGGSGRKYFPEIMLGGVSLLDADGDGVLDVFFSQGRPLPGHAGNEDFRDRLFRGAGDLTFTDVTATALPDTADYTFSAACPDLDGDGDLDLFLCNYGRNRVLLNDGQGAYAVASPELAEDAWSIVACFADYDGDSDLDAYVTNYVVYDVDHPVTCGEIERGPEYLSYCHPDQCAGTQDHYYRNAQVPGGAADLQECGAEVGVAEARGKGLGVACTDFDLDGDMDLFISNDAAGNFLWCNEGGTFTEQGQLLGVAQNGMGRNESCMGTDAGDVDGDGDFDLFAANLSKETNTLWTNDGDLFQDDTAFSGLAQDSLLWVGFGSKFFDQDLDGDLDLMLANGHVLDNAHLHDPHESFAQPAQLFENTGGGKFLLVGPEAGDYFNQKAFVGRGLAVGDLDNDGDQDVIITNLEAPCAILENRTIRPAGPPVNWLGLDLRGAGANTRALGARVELHVAGRVLVREVQSGSSYLSYHDTRLVFGLGEHREIERLVVVWPGGTRQSIEGLAPGRYHRIDQGAAEARGR